jgi:hypothetical protein
MNLATLLVHRRNRSLRPNAAAAWAQFSATSHATGVSPSAAQIDAKPTVARDGAVLHEP